MAKDDLSKASRAENTIFVWMWEEVPLMCEGLQEDTVLCMASVQVELQTG